MEKAFPQITLKAARVNAGLSQKEVAKVLGLNASTLRRYESGQKVPPWDVAERLSGMYKIPTDYIFFG